MSLPSPDRPLSTRPTRLQLWIADRRSTILGITIVAHVAHWTYLTGARRISPGLQSNRGIFAKVGLGWAAVYVGVLAVISKSHYAVTNSADPLLRSRYS